MVRIVKHLTVCLAGLSALSAAAVAETTPRVLYALRPAQDWESEALPLGNGRLGCMVFGGVDRERIQFNEDSLWIGDDKDTGAYQAFGDVFVDLAHADASAYRRELDITNAVHAVTYESNGVQYRRQYFASRPAEVLVLHFTADRPGGHTGRATLVDAHAGTVTAEGNRITLRGNLAGYVYGKEDRVTGEEAYGVALDYEAQFVVLHRGGSLTAEGGAIRFEACDSITLVLAAGTSFVPDGGRGWIGEHPHDRVTRQVNAAIEQDVADLLRDHVDDYQSLYRRVEIDLGGSPDGAADLPTGERVLRYRADAPDHNLEELMFQYARYLMISCSRPGARPANLQGLWNHQNNPLWRSDYHSDVNTQMHYWFVGPANLSECFEPLAEWLYSIRDARSADTRATFDKPGWIMHAENGLFGGSTWMWSKGDASWLAQNLWDHYAFTLDAEYLRTRAYPVMKDLCEFWLADLKELPDGKLVSPNGFSPEHGPIEDGVSYDQQLIWDLFTNTIEATRVLDVDGAFRQTLIDTRARLLGPQIGRWGQLQEWMVDRDDPDDKHRHLSHLVAVYPGRQVSPRITPELAKAAGVSLSARSGNQNGWMRVWKVCLWARLHEPRLAYEQLQGVFLLSQKPYTGYDKTPGDLDDDTDWITSNLLNVHPPLQVDANFGYAAAVCEMLVRSHLGEIELLPALPEARSNGSVRGLCARGGFELDLTWNDGRLRGGEIRSRNGSPCRLRSATPLRVLLNDEPIDTVEQDGAITFPTTAGAAYTIVPD